MEAAGFSICSENNIEIYLALGVIFVLYFHLQLL